jgi:hypothetical protein
MCNYALYQRLDLTYFIKGKYRYRNKIKQIWYKQENKLKYNYCQQANMLRMY